jgi:hypothetical protein
VLFSRKDVAATINRYFEPAWETVRPVPKVTIDFGNGNVITRTLHGNIATYVCTADGTVLDILPGIYAPATFNAQLTQFYLLSRYASNEEGRAAKMQQYHRRQSGLLVQSLPTDHLIPADFGKLAIERPLKALLLPTPIATGKPATAGNAAAPDERFSAHDALQSNIDLADWQALTEDTRLNETIRRRQIHDMLATLGTVTPQQVKKQLYREVLHADLDDPYLGLKPVLFATYPFQDPSPSRPH